MGPRLLFCYVVWIGCAAPAIKIDRVYYINLATSVRRRIEMERWLTKSNTSYVRVEAVSPPLRHSPDLRCETSRQESHRCRGIIGLRDSNFYIMDHLNTSGLTLVLEDDIELNISRLPGSSSRPSPSPYQETSEWRRASGALTVQNQRRLIALTPL